ncbi:acyl-[acyl-carrier-protein] thioesterase [Tannerella forsythia]|uniref:Acyl-[acyl-carrier-protein] thioesterase n=1 Tax=Tannerella forsythia TaxID=28112 RepID=A0A2A6EAS0_TANFO|nr:acyl-ACP thioesterase domain-containing protein [Tannerella forsythia]PDP44931.1 acyl-[acyl-carrier-protein] thioesterase [Tannerella forsythia]
MKKTEQPIGKVGTYAYQTEVYSLDFRGRLTIPTLGDYLLHAATCHAAERGYGYEDMEARNTAWVLSRLAIEISDGIRLSEPIRIMTWVERVERIFTYRCFEITTSAGETLGYARSVWAAIDKTTRRPVSLVETGLSDYLTLRPCPVSLSGKPAAAEQSPDAEAMSYTVKYSDLDINGHLNSIKYMEVMLDLFDIETYRTRSIARFEIAFLAEGRYGMRLDLYRRSLGDARYATAICHEGKAVCRAEVEFR